MLETVIVVAHLVMAIGIVGFVLIQQGKGAEAGASFGSGSSGTVFGAQGTGSLFSRITAFLAAIFFATSLGLAFYAKQRAQGVDELGLPSAALLEVQRQAAAPNESDIPQLDAIIEGDISDVPQVSEE